MDLPEQMEIAQGLLEAKGADQWEIMAVDSRRLSIAVRGSEVDNFQQSASQGLALRLVRRGRLGFAYLQGGDRDALARTVEAAWASALTSDLEDEAGLAPPGDMPAVEDIFDPQIADEPLAAKKERALTLARAAREADPRVVHVHPAEVSETQSQVFLRNSLGLDASRRGAVVSAAAMAVAQGDDGSREMGWEADSRRFLADLDVAATGAEAGRRAAAFIGAEPVPDGLYDVILENQAAAEFLELLSASLKGDNVVKGRSLLADRRGERVLSEAVSLVDDGLYPRGLGTAPFDDEGTPQGRRTLVDRGVVEGFVFDRLWGARFGEGGAGNASRPSLKAPPGVGFHNLYLLPGRASKAELIAGLDRGLVISELMGAHTADPVSGEFSLGAAGHLVEGGRLVRPVKSIAAAGQVVRMFASVKAAADDLRFFGSVGCPSLLVAGMSISGP